MVDTSLWEIFLHFLKFITNIQDQTLDEQRDKTIILTHNVMVCLKCYFDVHIITLLQVTSNVPNPCHNMLMNMRKLQNKA